MVSYGSQKSVLMLIKFNSVTWMLGIDCRFLRFFRQDPSKVCPVAWLEVRGMVVGMTLCLAGFALFLYGWVTMTHGAVISSSAPVVVGIFLGMAGLLVLALNLFSQGSLFN